MKRFHIIIFILLFSIAVNLCGCASSDEDESMATNTSESSVEETTIESSGSEPVTEASVPDESQETEPVTAATEESTAQPVVDEYKLDYLGVPFLWMNSQGDEADAVYRMTWNLEDGTITEGEYLFQLTGSSNLMATVWTGGNFFANSQNASECIDGVACTRVGKMIENFGQCFLDQQTRKLYCVAEEGYLTRIEQPASPVDENGEAITTSPIYMKILDNGEMLIVYQLCCYWMEGDTQHEEISLVYGFVPQDDPESARWISLEIPEEMVPMIDITENCATYDNGYLYLASRSDILVLDLETAELSYLGIREKMGALYADKDVYVEGAHFATWHKIRGCYDGILIVGSSMYDPECKLHHYYIAVKDGEILGVMESDEGHTTTLIYDKDLNLISQTDLFPSETVRKFPKDS